MKFAVFLLSALGFTSICYGSLKWLKIRYETIYSKKVNKEIKILHISDLHSNSPKKMNVDIWRKISNLDFNIAVITGDLIINKLEELNPHLKEIERLAKKVPVFYVDGNHEVYFYSDIEKIFKEYGINVLNNAVKTIEVEGNSLNIIGFRDFYYLKAKGFRGLDLPFKDLDKNKFTIVLTHQPQLFDRLKKHRQDLTIAGHTHGGQLRLPFLPTLFAPYQGAFPKYGDGWYGEDDCKMYVSRGIGTTTFPIRFFNRPEIAVITVKKCLEDCCDQF